MCLKVTGHDAGSDNSPLAGEHLVFVDHLCPECNKGSVDFRTSGTGNWDISIQAVQCPVGGTTIQYKFQDSSRSYIKFQIRNSRIPITSVQLLRDGQWVSLDHTDDNHWEARHLGQWPAGRITVRMTAANGQVIYDEFARIESTSIIVDGLKKVQVAEDITLPTA